MIYLTFERGDPRVSNTIARAHSRAVASVESKIATTQHKIFCVRAAVQRAFRLRFNIQPPTTKSICRWIHQFEQIGCLSKRQKLRPITCIRGERETNSRVFSVPHASQPVELAENLEYRNQLSRVC